MTKSYLVANHQAAIALHAAQVIRPMCGSWAARRYAEKRGVLGLYRLACQLEAITKAGIK